jgi:serine/threonine protein kinase
MSMIGKTLAHYEITSQLGKGGMGEVYQAKDRKLGRDVAIKVLPEEFARDADRVSRFQREAKLLASLNHPNIAAIYGLEESSGTNFLVLELVGGDTLADRIKAGPIPVEEALKLALQIAEALEAAHEKGVIHRDLKPANIKVTPEGKVKVLDFGLAKAFAGDQADVNSSKSPTLSHLATQQGVILGTAGYMSPEQAKGKTVDKRADIWAFGVVLFEMLTGRQLFTGETVSENLAAVLMKEPDFSTLLPTLHPRIRLLLERCLEKEVKNRYGSINDARVDIQKALADPSGVFAQPVSAVESRMKLRTVLPWVAAVVVLSVVAGVVGWKLKPPEPRQVMRFFFELPKDQQFSGLFERALAVSPDGRKFIYSTSAGLCLYSMDEMEAKLISGTGGNSQRPFFSPDGKWVGYLSSTDKKLKKFAIRGGAPVTLADAIPYGSINWGADDTIVFGQGGKGIMRISANGGIPEVIVKAEKNESIIHPQILPDGKSVLFSRDNPKPAKVMVQSLKSGERRELFAGDTARYLPTGHIVYGLGNNIYAIPFDLNALKVTSGPVSLVEGVLRAGGAPQYAVSESGTLVYIPATSNVNGRTLVWVDRKGNEEPLEAPPDLYTNPRISPDKTKVALHVSRAGGGSNIWIWDLVRPTLTRLTFGAAIDSFPLWTHNSKRIVFASFRKDGLYAVYWRASNGTGEDELLCSVPDRSIIPTSWADAKTLVFYTMPAKGVATSDDIGKLSIEGDHKWNLLLHQKYNENQPQVSPDRRWMAYVSNESGKNEVYVRPYPEVDKERSQVSTSGGTNPLWSSDGRELFYVGSGSIMAVSIKTEPTFILGTPTPLFPNVYEGGWDIWPDGKRFLMIKREAPHKINIVVNSFEELKQRVPSK